MSIGTDTSAAVDALKERFVPAVDVVDETVRQGRRAYARGRYAVEDAADAAALTIRHRPLTALALVAGAAAVAGAVIAFAVGRLGRCAE